MKWPTTPGWGVHHTSSNPMYSRSYRSSARAAGASAQSIANEIAASRMSPLLEGRTDLLADHACCICYRRLSNLALEGIELDGAAAQPAREFDDLRGPAHSPRRLAVP